MRYVSILLLSTVLVFFAYGIRAQQVLEPRSVPIPKTDLVSNETLQRQSLVQQARVRELERRLTELEALIVKEGDDVTIRSLGNLFIESQP